MQSDLQARLFDAVDAAFDQQVAFLSDLTAFPSTRGKEQAAQDFMAHALTARGYELERAYRCGARRAAGYVGQPAL